MHARARPQDFCKLLSCVHFPPGFFEVADGKKLKLPIEASGRRDAE